MKKYDRQFVNDMVYQQILHSVFANCGNLLVKIALERTVAISLMLAAASISVLAAAFCGYRTLDKSEYLMIIFLFFSSKQYVVTPHLNHLEKLSLIITKYSLSGLSF